jgi:hypothetical protein
MPGQRVGGHRWLVLVLGLLVPAPAASRAGDVAENLARLREMPLERRQALARSLDRFQALPAGEREAIRALDRQLSELPDDDRARYLAVLHRYHLWLRTLSEDQRQAIQAAPPEQRMALVRKLAAERQPPPWDRSDWAVFLGSTLNPSPLFDQAYAIRVWLGLEAAERAEIDRLPARKRQARLLEIGQQRGIADPRPPLARRLEENVAEQLANRPQLRKAVEALKPQAKVEAARRLAEARFLARFVPAPVDPPRLDRFATALPGWLLEPLDGLPPAPARQRLTVLYRLAFPDGQEMPDAPAKGASTPKPAEPKPAPAPGRPESASPF